MGLVIYPLVITQLLRILILHETLHAFQCDSGITLDMVTSKTMSEEDISKALHKQVERLLDICVK